MREIIFIILVILCSFSTKFYRNVLIIGGGNSGFSTGIKLVRDNNIEDVVILEQRKSGEYPGFHYHDVLGGCIKEFPLEHLVGKRAFAPVGVHFFVMLSEEFPWIWLNRDIVNASWSADPFEEDYSHLYITHEGIDYVVPLHGGFVEIPLTTGTRRMIKMNEIKSFCIPKDKILDNVFDGDLLINQKCDSDSLYIPFLKGIKTRKEYLEKFLNDGIPNEYLNNMRRKLEQGDSMFVPKNILYLSMMFPSDTYGLWGWFEYTMGVFFGAIPSPPLTCKDVVDMFIQDPVLKLALVQPIFILSEMPDEFPHHPTRGAGLSIMGMMEGLYFPNYGNDYPISQMNKDMIENFESNGGEVKIDREVIGFIIKESCDDDQDDDDDDDDDALKEYKVCGVRVNNRKTGNIEKWYANVVFSSAGYYNNYQKFVPDYLKRKFKYDEIHTKVKYVHSTMWVWLVVDKSKEEIGIENRNTWLFPGGTDFRTVADEFLGDQFDSTKPFPYMYISNSLKDKKWTDENPDRTIFHLLIPVNSKWFESWENSFTNERPDEYYALKDEIAQYMISYFKNYIYPDLEIGTNSVYEAETPLTQRDFLGYGYKDGYLGISRVYYNELDWNKYEMRNLTRAISIGRDGPIGAGIGGAMLSGVESVLYVMNKYGDNLINYERKN
jgi:hypothetical protein